MDTKVDKIKKMYRNDVKNITLPPIQIESSQKTFVASGPVQRILHQLKTVIAVTLEYEHQLVLLFEQDGKVVARFLEIPHPSGMFFDGETLITTSTRSPNQVLFFRVFPKGYRSQILPDVLPNLRSETSGGMSASLKEPLLLPVKSVFLPGQFSVHDTVKIGKDIYVVATGVNFLAKVSPEGGFERAWHPKCLDRLGKKAFKTNYLQLNSIARGKSVRECFFTGFSDQPTQTKPWKAGYGPKNKGVVFEGSSRETIYRGLTCPHSVRKYRGELWLCDSGMGELGVLDAKRSAYRTVAKLPGFTRGLIFSGSYAIIGLSKVIPKYEPYAPGLEPSKSQCGIVFVNVKTGKEEASVIWPDGFQVYDVQMLDGLKSALLPENNSNSMNYYLTYYGWDRKCKHKS